MRSFFYSIKNFFNRTFIVLYRFTKTKAFLVCLAILFAILLIWLIIPGISIFGFSILQTTKSKLYLIFFLVILALMIFLYKRGLLSVSTLIVGAAKQKKKKQKKNRKKGTIERDEVNYSVRKSLQGFFFLLKKKKSLNKTEDFPIYVTLGSSKKEIQSILRHTNKTTKLASSTISNKYNDNTLGWNVCDDKASIGLYKINLFISVFKLLYKHNRHYPINGLIYTINLADIFLSDSISDEFKEIESEIFNIRIQLETIDKKYNVSTPVYVVFSGLEVVKGFGDYFQTFSDRQRQEPLGLTFSSAKEVSVNKIYDSFKLCFEKMNNSLMTRCDATLPSDKVLDIISCSKQIMLCIKSLEPILNRFVESKIHEKALVRGIYFISYNNLDKSYDFMREKIVVNHNKYEQRVFFLQNLFPKVILKERYQFGENRQFLSKEKNKDYAKSIITVSLGVMASGLWLKSAFDHTKFFNSIDAEYNKALHSDYDTAEALSNLAKILEQSQQLNKYGLYYHNSITLELFSIYQQLLKNNFLPMVSKQIATKLKEAIDDMPVDKTPQSIQTENLYNWLATYLMLVDKKHMDTEYFEKNVVSIWSDMDISSDKFVDYKNILSAALISGFPSNSKIDYVLVSKARELLRINSTHILAYQMLKEDLINSKDNYILLGDGTDAATLDVFGSKTVDVPEFFTKKGYYDIYTKAQIDYLKKAALSMWVLYDEEPKLVSKVDYLTLKNNMDVLYWNDYLSTWDKAISEVNIIDIHSINKLIELLNNLSTSNNSLLSILKKIKNNTNFIGAADIANTVGFTGISKNIVSTKYNSLIRIVSEYEKMIASTTNEKSVNSPISELSKHVGKLRNAIVALSLSNQPTLDAYNAIQNKKESPIFKETEQIWSLSNTLPEPLKTWGFQIVNITTGIVNTMAAKEINNRWQVGPYSYYNQYLSNRYPLKLSSKKEASTRAFIEFFKKDGIFDTFVKDNLDEVVKKDSYEKLIWKNYYGVPFSSDTKFLSSINNLMQVKNMYFTDENGKGFKLFLTPEYLNKNIAILSIDYDGKSNAYANGPQIEFTIGWPNQEKNKTPVTINYTSKDNETDMINFDGEWGLFRFLQAGKIKYDDAKGQNKLTVFDSNKKILAQYLIKTDGISEKFNMSIFDKLELLKEIDNDTYDHRG